MESPVYQIVAENGSEWMASYPETGAPYPLPSFTIGDSRRNYYYIEGYWEEGKLLLLYVATGITYGGLQQGSNGYIYLPSGELTSRYWLDNYRTKRMTEHIYCYKYPSLGSF